MDNFFEIPVLYKETTHNFSAELTPSAYNYRIAAVDVFGETILFEPDEEGKFRALISYEDLQKSAMIDKNLVAAIAAQLVAFFRD
jgi:hypothetical protein